MPTRLTGNARFRKLNLDGRSRPDYVFLCEMEGHMEPIARASQGLPSLTELRLRNAEAKLARLIEQCEEARVMFNKGWEREAYTKLYRAIEEAKP
jgi:hypothetical protein